MRRIANANPADSPSGARPDATVAPVVAHPDLGFVRFHHGGLWRCEACAKGLGAPIPIELLAGREGPAPALLEVAAHLGDRLSRLRPDIEAGLRDMRRQYEPSCDPERPVWPDVFCPQLWVGPHHDGAFELTFANVWHPILSAYFRVDPGDDVSYRLGA
jgi:hypothetical protein